MVQDQVRSVVGRFHRKVDICDGLGVWESIMTSVNMSSLLL